MTVDVLDPADPDPAVGDAGVLGFEDMVDLEGAVAVPAGRLGDEPVLGEPPPGGLPGERIGRGGSPAGETAALVGDPPVDQAVFDAEFEAMVLAEAPWAGPEPGPAPVPPQAATGTRRAPPPRSPSEFPARAAPTRTATGVLREARRRPGPGPRSPPRRHNTSRVCDRD